MMLRSCAAGAGHWIGHDSKSLGGRYFCPKHTTELFAGFDPKPNDSVRQIDGSQREYVVLGRDGDYVTVRPLGLPGYPLERVSIHSLWPGPRAAAGLSAGCGNDGGFEPVEKGTAA